MPVQFNLKRDPTAGLVPAGVHRFTVEKVQEKQGAAGAYLNLSLRIFVNGVKWNSIVFEVLSTSIESKFRVDQFFDAVGAPEAGVAGEQWFVGKSGWAKFDHKEDNQGVLRSRVVQYLTAEQAENLKAKQAELDGSGDAESVPTQRSRQPVATADAPSPGKRATGKSKAAVAEMETDEDIPF